MKTKLNRKIPALVFCLLFGCIMASAQQFTAKGVVVDSNGEPVIGGGVALLIVPVLKKALHKA